MSTPLERKRNVLLSMAMLADDRRIVGNRWYVDAVKFGNLPPTCYNDLKCDSVPAHWEGALKCPSCVIFVIPADHPVDEVPVNWEADLYAEKAYKLHEVVGRIDRDVVSDPYFWEQPMDEIWLTDLERMTHNAPQKVVEMIEPIKRMG